MYAENTIFQGFHYGDGIKNMMEEKNGVKIDFGHESVEML